MLLFEYFLFAAKMYGWRFFLVLLFSVFLFLFQLYLCFKERRLLVKILPVFLIIPSLIYSVFMYISWQNNGGIGIIGGGSKYYGIAVSFLHFLMFSLSVALAWIIYSIFILRKSHKMSGRQIMV